MHTIVHITCLKQFVVTYLPCRPPPAKAKAVVVPPPPKQRPAEPPFPPMPPGLPPGPPGLPPGPPGPLMSLGEWHEGFWGEKPACWTAPWPPPHPDMVRAPKEGERGLQPVERGLQPVGGLQAAEALQTFNRILDMQQGKGHYR